MFRPPHLKAGDTVGIVAPASPQGAVVPGALEEAWRRGIAMLQQLGFQVRVAPHVLSQRERFDIPAYARAQDINAFFADDAVKAIFCASGGWDSHAVLPLLEWAEKDTFSIDEPAVL